MSRQPWKRLSSLLRKAMRKIFVLGRLLTTALFGYPLLHNVNQADEDDASLRALFVYLVEPFRLSPDDPRFRDHQNMQQCRQIASILGEAGYIVDVVDVNDDRFIQTAPHNEYDLVLSHRVDLGAMGKSLPKKTRKVYLSTGMNHQTYNTNLLARYERLQRRRTCPLKAPALNSVRIPFVKEADAIVGFGNDFSSGTWKTVTNAPLFPFNNYGYEDTRFVMDSKEFKTARKHFLFFASRNQVGKGLDLLLEIFPRHPDLHLYICSMFEYETDFCNCYRTELYHTTNIHPVGIVDVNSDSFYALVEQCAFVILPSCTEGQPGAVVQAMHTGLIPLLTKESGIDVGEFGWLFEDDSEQTIEQLVQQVAGLEPDTLKERALQTWQIATSQYSEAAFVKRWREIVAALKDLPVKGT